MGAKAYTIEEQALLRTLWGTSTSVKDILAQFPGRTQEALGLKARELGLRSCVRTRSAQLENLLPDTLENWYWYGFILADGHLTDRGELTITIKSDDEDHLNKLATKVCGKVKNLKDGLTEKGNLRRQSRFSAMNPPVIEKIRNKLGLTSSRKTEVPPDCGILERVDDDLFKALFIGFFDGDGCMRAKGYGQMVCHSAWGPVFELFEKRGLVQSVSVDTRARCGMPVRVASALKTLNVPKMERKWNKAK